MTSFRAMLAWGREQLKECGISDNEPDAWYLLEEVSGMDRASYFLHCEEEMPREQEAQYRRWIEARREHIPLQHITGKAWFMGLEFAVTPAVLVPRQDTEVLAGEAIRRLMPGMRILDMCTGSGCILLSLLAERPGVRGVGADISSDALEVARKNAARLERQGLIVEDQVRWVCGDLFEPVTGTFSMIVSNPPYIPTGVIGGLMPEVRSHDPMGALDGGADGLDFYRKIIKQSESYLAPGGWLLFEIGHDQSEAVSALMRAQQFTEINTIKDLAGLDRVVLGRRPGDQEERK